MTKGKTHIYLNSYLKSNFYYNNMYSDEKLLKIHLSLYIYKHTHTHIDIANCNVSYSIRINELLRNTKQIFQKMIVDQLLNNSL